MSIHTCSCPLDRMGVCRICVYTFVSVYVCIRVCMCLCLGGGVSDLRRQ